MAWAVEQTDLGLFCASGRGLLVARHEVVRARIRVAAIQVLHPHRDTDGFNERDDVQHSDGEARPPAARVGALVVVYRELRIAWQG